MAADRLVDVEQVRRLPVVRARVKGLCIDKIAVSHGLSSIVGDRVRVHVRSLVRYRVFTIVGNLQAVP